MVDVGEADRPALGRDPAGEPLAERNPDPLLHLLLQPDGSAGDQVAPLGVDEKHSARVDAEDRADAVEELASSASSSRWARLASTIACTCSSRTRAACSASSARALASAIATRSAASWSRSTSSRVKSRRFSVPTCSTPIGLPSTTSGTPTMLAIPLRRISGLRMSACSTLGRTTGRSSAAMCPAKPLPTAMWNRCSSSSSIPSALRDELVPLLVEEQDRAGVGVEERADAVEQVVGSGRPGVRERSVGHSLQPMEPLPESPHGRRMSDGSRV